MSDINRLRKLAGLKESEIRGEKRLDILGGRSLNSIIAHGGGLSHTALKKNQADTNRANLIAQSDHTVYTKVEFKQDINAVKPVLNSLVKLRETEKAAGAGRARLISLNKVIKELDAFPRYLSNQMFTMQFDGTETDLRDVELAAIVRSQQQVRNKKAKIIAFLEKHGLPTIKFV